MRPPKISTPRRATRYAAAALLLLAVAPKSALARDWLALPTATTASGLAPKLAAAHALSVDAVALGIDDVELTPTLVMGAGSTETVVFEQRYNGIRVLDRGAAVRFANAEPGWISLNVAHHLALSTTPSLDAAAASSAASAHVGHDIAPFQSELAVLGRGDGELVWVLDVREDLTRYVVDANTGAIALRIPVALDALGRVYAVSQVVTPMPQDLVLPTLAETASPVRLNGWSGLLQVTNYVQGNSTNGYKVEQTLGPSSGNDFLYNPPQNPSDTKDAFAQVNLFYHLTDMRDFFAGLGVDETTAKWKLTAVANAEEDGQPLDNAFYSPFGQQGPFAAPNLIAIGQGSFVDFAYDSDVFKHEFSHYVAGNTVNFNGGPFFVNEYGTQPLSGALDEGLADYYACSDNNSAVLGETALAPLGATRDLTDTHKVCPDDIGVESHADGELIGSVSWSIRDYLGQARADKLIWGAESTFGLGATFGDFYNGLTLTMKSMSATGELSPNDIQVISDILAKRGLDDCGPVERLKDQEARRTTIVGLELLAFYTQTDCGSVQSFGAQMQGPFHYVRSTQPGDSAVHFHVEVEPEFPDSLSYVVYVRRGAHVGYATDPNGLAVPQDFDYAIPVQDLSAEITIDATSNPPFSPGDDYYVSISSTSCPNLLTSVRADNIPTTTTNSTTVSSSVSTTVSSSTGHPATSSGASMSTGGGGANVIYIDRGCGCFVGSSESTDPRALGAIGLGALALTRFARRRRRA